MTILRRNDAWGKDAAGDENENTEQGAISLATTTLVSLNDGQPRGQSERRQMVVEPLVNLNGWDACSCLNQVQPMTTIYLLLFVL